MSRHEYKGEIPSSEQFSFQEKVGRVIRAIGWNLRHNSDYIGACMYPVALENMPQYKLSPGAEVARDVREFNTSTFSE